MCGLIGLFVNKNSNRSTFSDKRRFMEEGLFISTLRGADATGLALITNPNKVPSIYKRAIPATDFIQLKTPTRMLSDVDNARAVLGHTRAATKGWVSDENAHPFNYEHITLIHNGHISNFRALKAKCESDVDSAHVCAAIAEFGAKPVLEQLYGEYALVWHDAKEGSINFAKNGGRPLYWGEVPAWDGIAFASEYEMLGMLLARNKIKIKDKFYYPNNHIIFSFNLDNLKKSEIPFDPPATKGTDPPHMHGHRNRNSDTLSGPRRMSEGGVQNTDLTDAERHQRISELASRYRGKSPKHMKNSGRPSTEKNITKAREHLKKFRLAYDSIHGVLPAIFIAYKNQKKFGCGIVEFVSPGMKDLKGEIQNISKDVFDVLIARQFPIAAHVVNIRHYKNENVVVCELHQGAVDNAVKEYETKKRREELEAEEDGQGKIITLIRGPQGAFVSRARFAELTRSGCCNCGEVVNPAMSDRMKWIDDFPICHACVDLPNIIEILTGQGGTA